jgi:EAL and modified HD-GYP domain-containing signal transduction protein
MNLPPPLLFLHLLADRKLKPDAVMLGFGDGDSDSDSMQALVAHPDFSALVTELPCLVSAADASRLPADLLQSLQDAGCQLLTDDPVHRSDEQYRPALPVAARWLSGDWYLAPPAKPVGNQAASRALALKLVQLVAADADTREIEDVFRRDPVLAYHLLRLVNSLGMGMEKRISSFSQAILILGRQQLKRWLNLLLFSASKDDHRSAMLLARVAVRARSMELLAKATGLDRAKQDQAFMAGMFSLLGILFGLPLVEVIEPLHLGDVLSGALLRHEGETGGLLQAIKAAESADSASLNVLLDGLQIAATGFNQINLEAHRWMLDVIRDKQDATDG